MKVQAKLANLHRNSADGPIGENEGRAFPENGGVERSKSKISFEIPTERPVSMIGC